MRTLAIGDVHGCHTALLTLLQQIKPTSTDRLMFLGDYVDRGPASRQVIETLLELKNTCDVVFLRGNHEEMMLDARKKDEGWRSCGGLETLRSYHAELSDDWISKIPETHWKFVEDTQPFAETDTHIFVHACLEPDLDMNEQPEVVLFWDPFGKLKPHKSGKRIICGHTKQSSGKPADVRFAICIDTGAAYGGWLTCLDTETGKYWQTNEKGESTHSTL
jgi:serine/threonine protein phosphatase 1